MASHALLSRAGCTAPHCPKVNQDAVRLLEGWGRYQDAHWLSVMDGHGPAGHEVSSRVKQRLPAMVAEAWGRTNDVCGALTQGFNAASQDLKHSGIDILCSGTTCVACVLQGDHLYVANVGDSRAIICRAPPQDQEAPWTAVPLTRDHKPDLEDERRRIAAAGGRIAALQEEDGTPCGPQRWAAGCCCICRR